MTIKVNPNTCPKCGATIPNDAPQGLCPKCVLLGAATPTDAGLPPTATAEIPTLERVAAAFPQLEILELLGRGGMGFVFKARQPHLDRLVALKLLPDKLARDPHFAERFGREARVLAKLNHPGIVTIYDFGQAAGFYFLLMEYVDGVNLRQAMRAGRFSPAAALAVVPKICEALQFAHEQGVLHRDIKPENILLDAKGRVKIADFGIAKLVGDEKPDLNLTATGATIGTPQYMAPEQLEQPGTVDHRADIYSLGVVFYELLTGELPIGRFSPPSQRTPMDPRVDEVVMRTLEKEREKRFQSAGDVKTNIEHLTQMGAGDAAKTVPRPVSPDFVLCHPRLPRMAQCLTVYALLVAPVLWFSGLVTLDQAPHPNVYAAFVEAMMRLGLFWGELIITVLLFIGGWRLRALQKSGLGLIRAGIWLNLVLFVFAILGIIWIELLAPETSPAKVGVGEAVLGTTQLAVVVFQIIILFWLHRHRALLETIFQTTPPSAGPHGTIVISPGTPSAKKSPGSRHGVWKWAVLALVIFAGATLLWRELRAPQQRANRTGSALDPLPEGMVELVALTREPSDGVCWRADGTPANEGEFETYGTSPQVGPGQRAVVFIFRSRDSERQDASRTYDIEGAKSWVSGGPPRLNGSKVNGGSFVTATFPESLGATTVRVGVAIDAWETVATDAGTATGTFAFSRHGQARKVALFGATEDKSGATILTLTHDLPEEDVRVVAVDDRGHERASTTRHATGERHRFTLPNLAPDRIREYRFQVRPYRWAEFKKVQLSPASSESVRAPLNGSSTTNNATNWIGFTFTAVELREVDGKRWLAIDYLDNVHGNCEKSFPWETKIPGFRAEVRASEFAKDPQDPSAPRHQRIEYLLPDSLPRAPLEQLRNNVEKALKQKTIRLEPGQEKLLFEFGSSSDTALRARIKVVPPIKSSP